MSIINPPAKLDSAPWNARPTARPPEAMSATTLDIGTPRISIIPTSRSRYKRIFTALLTITFTVVFHFVLSVAFATALPMNFITISPTTAAAMASKILPP